MKDSKYQYAFAFCIFHSAGKNKLTNKVALQVWTGLSLMNLESLFGSLDQFPKLLMYIEENLWVYLMIWGITLIIILHLTH